MKRMIISFLLMSSVLLAGELYVESKKQTNGGYEWKLPAIELEIKKDKLIYNPEISLLFTSPRGDTTRINHHSFDINNNVGLNIDDYFITFSLGTRYIFDGNDDNISEGFKFYNTLRIGVKF